MSLSRGYRNYRGRTPKWKVVLAVVLVLVILAAGVVILMQQYIVYDETGTPHLRLPEAAEMEQAPEDSGQVDLTIQEPERTEEIRAFSISGELLTSGDWRDVRREAQLASAPAYNALAVTLKDSAGHVYFDAASAVSGAAKTSATTMADLAAMTGEENGDYYTVARLSCFHDSKAANADVEGMGLKNTGGYIFYDGNNSQWLDPGKSAARAYLCQLVRETAELGFDEILLTDVSYPTQGKLDKIAYGDGDRAQHLQDFLAEARAVLEPYGAALSIELPEKVITEGTGESAGLSLAQIAPLVDRVYAETASERVNALSAAVAAASAKTDFVPELETLGPEVTGSCVISK